MQIDGYLCTQQHTVGDEIIVPMDKEGVVANWQGVVPFENLNHRGELGIVVGPWAIQIAAWGDANTGDTRENSGTNSVKEFKDLFPVPEELIPLGVYQLSGEHQASGGTCTGTVTVKLEGSSAIGIGSAPGAGITFVSVISAGLRRKIS